MLYMNRRNFFEFATASAILLGVQRGTFLLSKEKESQSFYFPPPLLKKGSKVVFTAPGSPANFWEVRNLASFFCT